MLNTNEAVIYKLLCDTVRSYEIHAGYFALRVVRNVIVILGTLK